MSEVLRELVVALSLDSDNFSRNLRTINQQIKEAESTFRLAGAGHEGNRRNGHAGFPAPAGMGCPAGAGKEETPAALH